MEAIKDHGSKSPCNKHLLKDDLKKLLHNMEQLKRNGASYRKVIEEKFNIQTIAKEVLKVYAQTIKRGMKM